MAGIGPRVRIRRKPGSVETVAQLAQFETSLTVHSPLADSNWLVCREAGRALGRLGLGAAPTVPALLRARTDPDQVVWDTATQVLRELAKREPRVRDTVPRELAPPRVTPG